MAHDIEVTDEQIETLKAEAGAHGDDKQVGLCDLALSGDPQARDRCVQVIRNARAQAD